MIRLNLKISFLGVAFLGILLGGQAQAIPLNQPMLAIACYLDVTAAGDSKRANGYDCTVSNALKKAVFSYDNQMSDNEILLRQSQAFYSLALNAEKACGKDCRFFYGTQGYQCLAVAQNDRFTGLGSFMGKETSQQQAEQTALQDCRTFVGDPGAPCRIILSACP